MNRLYRVECVETCADCNGEGTYDNPEWQALFAEEAKIAQEQGRKMTCEEFNAFVENWEKTHTLRRARQDNQNRFTGGSPARLGRDGEGTKPLKRG